MEDHCCHTDCSFPEQTTPVRRDSRCHRKRGGKERGGGGEREARQKQSVKKMAKNTFMDARSEVTNSPQVLGHLQGPGEDTRGV